MLTNEQMCDILNISKQTLVLKGDLIMTYNSVLYFIHNHYKALVISLCILIIGGAIVIGTSDSRAKSNTKKCFECIEIEADDTLWTIAEEYMTSEYDSIEDYIDEVKSINNLTGDIIIDGGSLIIPYYAEVH